jgi:hypothetical protein
VPREARRYDNPGKPPTKWPRDTALSIEWANGSTSPRTYTRDQLVWEKRGFDFDIARFWRA